MKIAASYHSALDVKKKASEIKAIVKSDIEKIDGFLINNLKSENSLTKDILNHVIDSGGKRIRPLLSVLSGKIFDHESDEVFYLAAAVELIHSATLLHDDVIDKSDKRRGLDTVNNIWDNKSAILAGDFIFAKSFELMVKTNNMEVLANLAKASSVISEGEIAQLELINSNDINLDKYLDVIAAKTARLFAESCRNSALVAGVDSRYEKLLYDFGFNLGMIFQVIDDVLDYFGDKNLLGKNIGDDFFENKITLPVIILYNELNSKSSELLDLLNKTQKDKRDFQKILTLMSDFGVKIKAIDFVNKYYEQAIDSLSQLPQNQNTNILKDILEISLSRIN
jgi:octaprenyl-diphosphate synthase